MNNGYSGTPLLRKLGIKPEMLLRLYNPPPGYFEWLGQALDGQCCSNSETPDMVHLFCKTRKEMEKALRKLKPVLAKNNRLIIWVSWYKQASGLATDLNENVIREYALAHQLVDVKVCAVSEEWSGLKLVVPLAKRQ